jgi:glycerol-3-phosphate acyltransferase PlsY
MISTLLLFLFAIIAYLMGSLSAAIITCKLMGLADPRSEGSNNPGTTNVLRIGGKKAALITLLGDMLKGTIPVLIASIWINDIPLLGIVGLAAFLGHLYPVFFSFLGGKGVATYLGVLLGVDLELFLFAALCWIVTAIITRFSSLSALVSALATTIFTISTYGANLLALSLLIMTVFLIVKHKTNIIRLLNRTEPKIGKK